MVVIHCVLGERFVDSLCVFGEREVARSVRRVCRCRATVTSRAVQRGERSQLPQKGLFVPCFVDRQRQAHAANHQPRRDPYSPLPSVNTSRVLLTIVYVYVYVVEYVQQRGIVKGQNWVCMGKAVLNAVSKGFKQTCVSEDQGAHQAQQNSAKHALLGNALVGNTVCCCRYTCFHFIVQAF